MLSSWQIAQMHQAQGQAFGQQQAFSQQLSARMPAPYQGVGLGAQGFSGGFGQQMGYGYGGGFGGGASYGPGNSFGNTMTSAIGGIGHAVGSGMGIGGAILGGMRGGLGGAMMGFGVGSLVGGGIKHVAGAFMEGAHEQSALERTLSQFQFQNAAGAGGRGFSRSDSQQIGNVVRQMERMPEMLTSFGELNRIMDKMGQMGLMNGIRDAGEFSKKFKDTIGTLKDMAKMIGTTMEGALQAFQESRMSGFYSTRDIKQNVMNRTVTASLTGMSQDQIGGLQRYGAEMAHSLGGSRRGGAAGMLRTAGQLGMMNQMGILSNDQIMEMTGKEGAAGIQDLAGSMGQLTYRMGQSNVGTALTLALGAQKDGRYTGEMDQELVEKVRRGEISLGELKSLARRKASTRGAKLSYAAHKNRLRTEMAGSVGSEGIGMQLQEILGERGWQNPDAINLVMQRFGASEEQANLLQKMMPNLQNIGSQMGIEGKQQARQSARNAAMAENGFDAIKAKIGKKLAHYTTDWAKDMGNATREYFQNFADEVVGEISGQYREYVTKRLSETIKYAGGGSGAATGMLRQMIDRSAGIGQSLAGGRGGRLDVGGGTAHDKSAFSLTKQLAPRALHSIKRMLGGSATAGEKAVDLLGGIDDGMHLTRGGTTQLENDGTTILDSGYFSRDAVGVTQNDVKNAMKRLRNFDTLKGGLNEWNKVTAIGGKGSESSIRAAYRQAMMRGDIQMEQDPKKRADMAWKEMRKQLPADVLKNLEDGPTSRYNIMAGAQAAEAQAGNVYKGKINFEAMGKGYLEGLDTNNQAAIGKAIEEQDKNLSKKLGDTWSFAKKQLDSGSQISKLLLGDDKHGGLLSGGEDGKLSDRMFENKFQLMLSKEKLGDDDKALLTKMGIDPEKLQEEMAKDPEAMAKLVDAAKSGKLTAKDVAFRVGATDRSGLVKTASELKRAGSELTGRLTGDSFKSARGALEADKQGKEVIAMLKQHADSFSGATADNLDSVIGGNNTADIAEKIAGMKDGKLRKYALDMAGDDVNAAYSFRQGMSKQLRGARGGGVDKVLAAAGITLGSTEQDLAFRKELEGKLGKDKKLNDKGELEAVLKTLTGQKGMELFAKEGVTGNSKYMSEQEVANNMKMMSDNNLKASQILADLATGQKVGTTAAASNK